MRLNKKHKLYFRSPKQGSTDRRVDKVAPGIFLWLVNYFIRGEGNTKYNKHNEDVKTWQEIKAIDVWIPAEHAEEFKKMTPFEMITITYNSAWRPLANLRVKK